MNPHVVPRAEGLLMPLTAAGAFCLCSSSSGSTGSLHGLEGEGLVAPHLKDLTAYREGWEEVGDGS